MWRISSAYSDLRKSRQASDAAEFKAERFSAGLNRMADKLAGGASGVSDTTTDSSSSIPGAASASDNIIKGGTSQRIINITVQKFQDAVNNYFNSDGSNNRSQLDAFMDEMNEAWMRLLNSANELEFEVKLQAVTEVADDGLLIIPKLGSKVFCVSEGNSSNVFTAVSYTAIEKLIFKQADSSLQVDSEGIQLSQGSNSLVINSEGWTFNNGTLNGLVKLDVLVENLNSIKKYVEAINSALPTAFTAIGSGTTANGGNGATSYNGSMAGQAVVLKNMENDKIKQ